MQGSGKEHAQGFEVPALQELTVLGSASRLAELTEPDISRCTHQIKDVRLREVSWLARDTQLFGDNAAS